MLPAILLGAVISAASEDILIAVAQPIPLGGSRRLLMRPHSESWPEAVRRLGPDPLGAVRQVLARYRDDERRLAVELRQDNTPIRQCELGSELYMTRRLIRVLSDEEWRLFKAHCEWQLDQRRSGD